MLSDKFHHSSSTIFDASSTLLFRSFLAPSRIMVRSFFVIFCAFSSVFFARRRCISIRNSNSGEGSTSKGARKKDSILEDLLVNLEQEIESEGVRNSDFTLEDLLVNLEQESEFEGLCNTDFVLEELILTEGRGNLESLVVAACMVAVA
jgi:hypothetical protein